MNRLALAALAVPLAALPTLAVDFDSGVDASAVLVELKASAARTPAWTPPPASYRPDGREWDVDCKTITFKADEKGDTLGAALESHDVASDCQGYAGEQGRCGGRRRGSLTHFEGAAVKIQGRKPLMPWESDTFRVCLEGSMVDMTPLDTAYDYTIVSAGTQDNGWLWTVAPAAKRLTPADPAGITAQFTKGAFQHVLFTDRWAEQYKGEGVAIQWEIKRAKSHWPDSCVDHGELVSPTQSSYDLDISGLKLDVSKEYYVSYRIRRIGAVSKDGFGETQRSPAFQAITAR